MVHQLHFHKSQSPVPKVPLGLFWFHLGLASFQEKIKCEKVSFQEKIKCEKVSFQEKIKCEKLMTDCQNPGEFKIKT
jgi:hypothetical protein